MKIREVNTTKFNNYLFYGTLIISFILICIIILINQGTFALGDGIRHYLISRFSWQHPYLFLDHWGKPLFTLLSSPFAQFGFEGVMFFNLIIFVLTSIALKQIVEKIFENGKKFSFIIPFILLSPEVYIKGILGGYTEILFSFLVVLGLLALIKEKYILSAVIISFLPFSRPEYVVIMPLFAIIFIYRKKYYQILFFLTAFILYSFVGMLHYHDFFWFITTHPYKNKSSIYGSGSLFHFVNNYIKIYGFTQTLLIILGLISFLLVMFKEKWKAKYFDVIFFLVIGGFTGVLTVHSYFWYKGLHASLGLIRVLATTSPLTVILIGFLIQKFSEIKKFEKYKAAIIATVVTLSFIPVFSFKYYPIKYNNEAKTILKATDWTKENKIKYERAVLLNSLIAKELNLDIFDNKKTFLLWSINRKKPIDESLQNNDLIFWDSHLGPNEGRTKLDSLIYNEKIELLRYFLPDTRITTLGGKEFCAFIFKINDSNNLKTLVDTFNILNIENQNLDNNLFIEAHDFGQYICSNGQNSILYFSAKINFSKDVKDLFLVIKVEKNKNLIYKATFPLSDQDTIKTLLPEYQDSYSYKYYIYNPQKQSNINISAKISLITIQKIQMK